MASTTRKLISAIGAGIALLAVVLWLAHRHQQPAAVQVRPAAEIVATPTARPADAPSAPTPSTDAAVPAVVLAQPVAVTPKPNVSLAPTAPAVATAKPAAPTAPTASVSTPTPTTPDANSTNEVAATSRMYVAHASLRAPDVANPDSEPNRQILQTMVTKALSRASEAKPAATK